MRKPSRTNAVITPDMRSRGTFLSDTGSNGRSRFRAGRAGAALACAGKGCARESGAAEA